MVVSGGTHTEETKARMSAAKRGENNPMFGKIGKNSPNFGSTRTEKTKARMSAAKRNENNPIFGKIRTEETKAKISAANTGRIRSEESRSKQSASITGKNNHNYGKTLTEETKAQLSAANSGENSSRWQGGISFEPYCPRFNYQLKEQIRNRDNRTCVLCGKGEIQNGKRLAVHHIDSDKMQGCNHAKWYLCALCNSCNSKPDTVEKEFLIVTNGGISV